MNIGKEKREEIRVLEPLQDPVPERARLRATNAQGETVAEEQAIETEAERLRVQPLER